MALWKDAKRSAAQQLITFLQSTNASSGSWPLNYPTSIAFAELRFSSSNPEQLTQSGIMQTIKRMTEHNRTSVQDFEAIYEDILKADAMSANQQRRSWHFLIPLAVILPLDTSAPTRIRVLGKTFTFLSLAQAEINLDQDTRAALHDIHQISIRTGVTQSQIPDILLSVSTRPAPSWQVAWRDVELAFDALRGISELSLNLYRWRLSSGWKSPRRAIPHPLWGLVYHEGRTAEWIVFETEEESTATPFDLTSRFPSIQKNAETLRRVPTPQSTQSLIADCLRLYSQAMQAHFRHLCLLGFWQLAEAITRAESVGGHTAKVTDRLAWHAYQHGFIASGYRETLSAIGKKRNDIVHRGIHDIQDEDINILKLACEFALTWLFSNHKRLPTVVDIEKYYQLRETNQTDLTAIKRCLAILSKRKAYT